MRAVLLLAVCAGCSREATPPAPSLEIRHAVAPTRHTISAGVDHACARTPDGHVACWGELANLATVMRGSRFFADLNPTRPVIVAGLDHVAGVEAGADVHCAWTERGEVSCWGAIGSQSSVAPTRIAKLDHVVQVSGGQLARMLCAVERDGRVACWGDPSWDRDAPEVRAQALIAPAQIHVVPGLHDAVDIAVGFDHACARSANGAVACWAGPAPDRVDTIAPANGAISIAGTTLGGGNTFIALLRGGRTYGWQLPDPSGAPIHVPDHLPADASSISLGSEACVLASPVMCWAIGGTDTHTITVDHPVDLTAGIDVTCARLADGSARCWGRDGLRGDGVAGQALEAMPVPGLANVTSLSVDDRTTCARLATNQVMCWGANETPQRVRRLEGKPLSGTSRVSHGGFAREGWTCETTASDVRCVHEHYGRDGTDRWPEHGSDRIAHGREVISVPPGAGMCVRMADGGVTCSDVGEDLVPVPGITDAIALGHGPNDSICALEASGTVACWPEELRAAHLGPSPALVTGATDAKQLATGPDHACILRSDGTVRCWGAWSLVGTGAVPALDAPRAVLAPR